MNGLMALVQLDIYPRVFGQRAPVDAPEFWFAMQVAMVGCFSTAFPTDWWLIRSGVKERMWSQTG